MCAHITSIRALLVILFYSRRVLKRNCLHHIPVLGFLGLVPSGGTGSCSKRNVAGLWCPCLHYPELS